MNTLFLLDAYALIFRAYYALIKMPRITQAGFNTSAIFGFVNTLEELLRKEKPSHIAVCFDPSGPTFRNEAYEGYKAERSATPEDIKLSVPIIKEIVKAYGIKVVETPGFEADDVIGTLARMASEGDFTTYMMTPDKDFGQLVGPNILQYKPAYRGQDFELRGEKEICERYGLKRTEQVIDYLALVGDKIDNIPGCPHVGEKRARELIEKFDNVENLLAHTEELRGAVRKNVEENAEQIRFSKFLATIRTDAPVDVTPFELRLGEPDRSKLFAIFDELEFKTLKERVGRRLDGDKIQKEEKSVGSAVKKGIDSGAPSLFDESDFENEGGSREQTKFKIDNSRHIEVSDSKGIEQLRHAIENACECGVRIIAEGENDMGCLIKGIALSFESGDTYYIRREEEEGISIALDTLARRDIVKICSDAKRDYVLASRMRQDCECPLTNYRDVQLAHYLLQPEMRHTLRSLSPQYLGYELIGDFKENESSAACEEAEVTLKLFPFLEAAVEKAGMRKMLEEMELPLVRVLAEMEITGVRIDTEALQRARHEMEERIEGIEKEIYSLTGMEFNVGSPAKVGEVLFDHLKLDAKAKKTKTGQYSTSEDILEKLTGRHPVVEKILKYRQLRKLVSTYLAALPAAINPATGKVHTNYNQAVTATGRLSSSSPNLQNIPVRDDEGRAIRRAFIADENCIFLSADYSQIELRLLADFSGDKIMLEAFREGKDIHSITASKIYHEEESAVTADQRRHAKTANFGIVYGISAFGLASRLNISRAEAKEIIDNYFATFPTVKKYMSDSVEHAREQGYVTTRLGRRRMLSDINSRNPVVRGYAERNAINAPLQGTAADVIKIAMIRIFDEMERRGLKSRMIMQVHDELNFNVAADETAEMQELVARCMRESYQGKVELTASCGIGTNWLEAH